MLGYGGVGKGWQGVKNKKGELRKEGASGQGRGRTRLLHILIACNLRWNFALLSSIVFAIEHAH